MIVVDASAIGELVLLTPAGLRAGERLFARQPWHAPELIDLEVTQALRRLTAAGTITPRRAQEAFDDFLVLAIERHSHGVLMPRVWELRHNVSAYDAAYVALAEALAVPLVTGDVPLTRAPGLRADVELL